MRSRARALVLERHPPNAYWDRLREVAEATVERLRSAPSRRPR